MWVEQAIENHTIFCNLFTLGNWLHLNAAAEVLCIIATQPLEPAVGSSSILLLILLLLVSNNLAASLPVCLPLDKIIIDIAINEYQTFIPSNC